MTSDLNGGGYAAIRIVPSRCLFRCSLGGDGRDSGYQIRAVLLWALRRLALRDWNADRYIDIANPERSSEVGRRAGASPGFDLQVEAGGI